MRLEFSYLWDEWIEARRAYLGHFRFLLTKYAEATTGPLAALFVLSFATIFFSFMFQIQITWMRVAQWTFLITLVLIGLSQIYLSTVRDVNRKVLRREWEETAKYLRYSLDIEDDGIVFNSVTKSNRLNWDQINWYFETNQMVILCKEAAWLAIPKRIFSDKEQLRNFLWMVYYQVPLEMKPIS